MKKYILLLLVIATTFSCKDYLEEQSVTTLTQDYYKTAEGLQSLVKGSYQILRFKSDYNQGNYIFGIGSDVEAFSWSNADRVAMGSYNISGWDPASTTTTRMTSLTNMLIGGTSGNFTEGAYPEIARCNIFFENYANLTAADQTNLSARKGEMLFLRSYAYFLVTNALGDAPLILKPVPDNVPNFNFPKEKMEVIYNQIIKDMRQAVDLLPTTSTELGRITKPAAQHFLAKLYLVRAQGAEFQNSAEPTLKALYKGANTADLDSAVYYSTQAINQISSTSNAAYGGLTPNFATLFTTTSDYARDAQKEILLSAQYEPTQTYDGRYGNTLVHLFNSNHTTLRACTPRTLDYGRPYATAGATDWGYDQYTDRVNDSRYYKTFLTDYIATATTTSGGKTWEKTTAFYYNNYLKSASASSAVVGAVKITLGGRSIVYIENSKDQPLDSLWVVSQPYIMMVRWMAGSPNKAGYFNADGTPKAGAMVDPTNPVRISKDAVDGTTTVITTAAGNTHRLYYRLSGDQGNYFGLDRGNDVAQWYMGPRKWLDQYRGKSTDVNGSGSIDIPLMRLAETYLIRAEAYGRKGDYTSAITDLNVLRKRAAYHSGEKRSDVLMTLEPAVITGKLTVPASEKTAPYAVTTDSYDKIKIDGTEWQAGTAKGALENYPAEATTDLQRFIQFIYNERGRELIFELTNVEDLHNAGIWYERIRDRDNMGAPATSKGTVNFPFPYDYQGATSTATIGAKGIGKGTLDRKYSFKPWPLAFIQLLTDENNVPLDAAAQAAYQNSGY